MRLYNWIKDPVKHEFVKWPYPFCGIFIIANICTNIEIISSKPKQLSDDSSGDSTGGDSANVEAKEELLGKIEEKIKTTENPNSTANPDAPEIKANNADLGLNKDTDLGMSDLKKP